MYLICGKAELNCQNANAAIYPFDQCFSKKPENLKAAVALHFSQYNFVRIHGTLPMTPALAAGVTVNLWTIRDLIGMAND